MTNALNQTTGSGYDAIDNLTTVTDPLSRTTTYAYDTLNRLTSVTDALSQVTSYAYDANANLTLVTDANGNETRWTYDALGRALTATDDLLQTTSYNYAFRFTGEQVDAGTGFVYLRARYMDPGTGRFISQDPIGLAGGGVAIHRRVEMNPCA